MAATVTLVGRLRMGIKRGVLVDITFGDSYPTGGDSVVLPLAAVDEILFSQKSGYLFEYDRAEGKIKVYTPVGTASNHTHAVALDTGVSAAPSATAAVSVLQAVPLAGIQDTITAEGTKYIGPADNAENNNEDVVFVVPADGKIVGLFATLGTAPGSAGESAKTITLTVRKNGADTDLECEIAADAVSGIDTTVGHAVDVSAGNKISVKSVAAESTVAADLNVSLLYQITGGTAAVPTAAHTHGPGTLADAASAPGGALSAAAASEVANGTNLSELTVRAFIIGF
ncbi:MAG: hypothetical protein M0P69_08235 [Bacteroidales bacterium]|nr:hypothetical protein [Bacteroidales bacterium]